MFENCLFLSICDSDTYIKMTNNLFRSLKYYHSKIKTACFSKTRIENSDIFLDINKYYKTLNIVNNNTLNDFNLSTQDIGEGPHVGYSFKIGLMSLLETNIRNDYEKIIYLDADSECVDEMHMDDTIKKAKVFTAFCQSIVTQNISVSSRINNDWYWNGKYFYEWQKFAKYYNIKEWKNVNGGLYIVNTNYTQTLKNHFVEWNRKIMSFFNSASLTHNDELVMSLIHATEEGYNGPDIARNGISQINTSENFDKIKEIKKFNYYPWFFSNEEDMPINVKATCVHSPGSKEQFIIK